ncbi:MAG: hypothetical protein ACI3V3_08525 [Faecousia sp.]
MKRFLKYGIPAILLLAITATGLWFFRGKNITTGTCVVTGNGGYLIVDGNTPVVMSNRTGREDPFEELETGDSILIVHDGIRESWPAQTDVYLCLRTGDGSLSQIPTEVVDDLKSMGWMP